MEQISHKEAIVKSDNEYLFRAPGTKYIKQFMSYNCTSDVLMAVGKIRNVVKEVTESMAVVKTIKKEVLKAPGAWNLVEFCADNSLTSVLLAHLFSFNKIIAIGMLQRKLHQPVLGYTRAKEDIYELQVNSGVTIPYGHKTIFLAIHACGDLSHQVINLYHNYHGQKMLIIMPCCIGKSDKFVPRGIRENFSRYQTWVYQLAKEVKGDFWFDKYCMSPCDGLVVSYSWK